MNSKLRQPTNIRDKAGLATLAPPSKDKAEMVSNLKEQEGDVKESERDTACTAIEIESDKANEIEELGAKVMESESNVSTRRTKDLYDEEIEPELLPKVEAIEDIEEDNTELKEKEEITLEETKEKSDTQAKEYVQSKKSEQQEKEGDKNKCTQTSQASKKISSLEEIHDEEEAEEEGHDETVGKYSEKESQVKSAEDETESLRKKIEGISLKEKEEVATGGEKKSEEKQVKISIKKDEVSEDDSAEKDGKKETVEERDGVDGASIKQDEKLEAEKKEDDEQV